jgi:hypothetical protein
MRIGDRLDLKPTSEKVIDSGFAKVKPLRSLFQDRSFMRAADLWLPA